jgi:hydrogenase-4 component F
MWKYLLICSVGIALALLGTFFFAAAVGGEGSARSLLIPDLIAAPPSQKGWHWLKLGFIFFLVGYGTKTGLAPFHTWLPDAHSEAPSIVSVLLSGALLNCAMLALLRGHQICLAAGLGNFSGNLLIFFGLLSVVFAALFIVRQTDYKRMLAYSSVEHMGLVAIGAGLGGLGGTAALLHVINHSCTKALLFMAAGNILSIYRTKSTQQVFGLMEIAPLSAFCWMAGFLAITGLPPFGLFVSEFLIVKAAFENGHVWVGVACLVLLAVIFAAMAAIVLGMTLGPMPKMSALRGYLNFSGGRRREPWAATVPPLLLLAVVLGLGLYLPQSFKRLLSSLALLFGGGSW